MWEGGGRGEERFVMATVFCSLTVTVGSKHMSDSGVSSGAEGGRRDSGGGGKIWFEKQA